MNFKDLDPQEFHKNTTVVVVEGGSDVIKVEYIDPISPRALFGKQVFLKGFGERGEIKTVAFRSTIDKFGQTRYVPYLVEEGYNPPRESGRLPGVDRDIQARIRRTTEV